MRFTRRPSLPADDVRSRIRSVLGIEESRGEALAARVLATIKKPGYRAEQFEFTSEREIRTPGWLLTPDNAGPSTPTLLYVGEAAAWSSVAEDAFAERLCATGRCRVAVIDVRGRGDCAIGYPPRGRFYFPGRITDEAYLTWFTLMLGKPLLGGQVYDTLRALDYLRSRSDGGGRCVARRRRPSRGDRALRRGARCPRSRRRACARPLRTIVRSPSPNATPSRSASTRTASCGNSTCPTWRARLGRGRCSCSTP